MEWAFISILSSLVSLFVLYWIIRLAVRGGIEDAARRRAARLAEEQMWRTIEENRGQER